MSLLAFLVVGLIAGLLARALMPGNQSMGLVGTMILGVVGSFVGGLVSSFIRSDGELLALRSTGILWSTVGAIVVLAIAGAVGSRRRAV